MPQYDYKCPGCSYKAVLITAISADKHIADCRACNIPLVRDYQAVSVAFKGSGFYSTDKK